MAVTAIRDGFHTVTPYLTVREAPQLIEFVKQAFGAIETFRGTGSAGGMHAEVRIGNSMIMIGGGGRGEPMPSMLYLYMENVDAVYQRALQAGAISIMEPTDRLDGDRLAGVKDQFSNIWYVATHVADLPLP